MKLSGQVNEIKVSLFYLSYFTRMSVGISNNITVSSCSSWKIWKGIMGFQNCFQISGADVYKVYGI